MSSQTSVVKRPLDDSNDQSKKKKTDYLKGGLVHSMHGNIYQLKLLMLFLKRGLDKGYCFRLATEWDEAEKFDDLVFEYTDNNRQTYRFLQAKHKQDESKTITVPHLLTEKDDEFSLKKYFLSFRKIKRNSEMFHGPQVEVKDFVICTNIDLCDELQNSFETVVYTDDILAVEHKSKECKFFKFRESGDIKKENLANLFHQVSDLRRLAEKLHSHVFSNTNDNDKSINLRDDIFRKYHGALAENVIDIQTKKFKIDFINDSLNLSVEEKLLREALFEKSKFKSNENFKKELLNKDLKFNANFGRVLKLQQNPEITTNESSELAKRIVDLILQKNTTDIVSIVKKADIVKKNIDKLAGHVFIETEDDKMQFRQGFLNGDNLPGNLNDFRNELKKNLSGPNAKIQFSDLVKYQFKINIYTCTEDDYDKYKNNPSYFESFHQLPNDEVQTAEIDEYLDRLVFAVNQPNEIELSEVIKTELGKEFNTIDTKNVYSRFLEKMLDWMKAKEGRFISHDDGNAFFEMLKSEILGAIWFDVKDPVRLFTGRKYELKRIHNVLQRNPKGAVVSHMTSVSGLGGIGKSELVRKYAYDYGQCYDGNVVWINAGTDETLSASFLELALDNRLGIPMKDINGKEKKAEAIIKEIYAFFAKKKSLFIFDNADEPDNLIKFLPVSSLTPDSNKPFILITSRIREWESGIEVIKLKELAIEDAIQFVRKGLDIPEDDESQNVEIKNLVETLQCFPLAIQQAISFIEYERQAGKFSIDDYIKEYEKKAKSLLGSKLFKGIDNNYAKTTFTTWTITTDKIALDEDYGHLALKVLDVIAYFAPDNIKREIFLQLAENDERDLKSAVRLLVKYSMVSDEHQQSILSVHRLVQDVTRINLNERKKVEEVTGEAFALLKESFPNGSDQQEDVLKKKHLLPHCEAFISNVDKWLNILAKDKSLKKDTISEKKKIMEESYIEEMLKLVADGCTDLGNPERKKELLERALQIEENHYGRGHFNVSVTLRNLGVAYGDLGNHQKKRELVEEALAHFKEEFGPNSLQVADTLNNLANAYGNLGNNEKKMELLEQALPIVKDRYGPDSVEVASMVMNLGNVWGERGFPDKQRELIEWALPIIEKHYGCDHFKVGFVLNNLSNAYNLLGNYTKQKFLLERALKIYERHYPPESPFTAIIIRNLGSAFGDLQDHQQQKTFLERALSIQEKHFGLDHFEVGKTLSNLSNAYSSLGDYSKQKKLLERALIIFEKRANPAELGLTLGNLGDAYGKLKDLDKQMEFLKKALLMKEHCYGVNSFKSSKTIRNLGIAYGDIGNYEKKKELLERVLAIDQKHFGLNHFEVGKTLYMLGFTNAALHNHEEERILFERAVSTMKNCFESSHSAVTETQDYLNKANEKSCSCLINQPNDVE